MPLKKSIAAALFAASLAASSASWAFALSADDFLPPVSAPAEQQEQLTQVQGKITQKQDPEIGVPVVEAATTQDAINHVVNQRRPGSEMIRVGSGIGWVATGAAFYENMPNETASRISRRNAYVRAYMEAQRQLAESLNGLTSEGQNRVAEAMSSVTDAESDMSNFSMTQSERIEQSVQMLMRGFVIYSVEDRPEENSVHVSIVTTPKTRGELNRVALNGIEAQSVNEGLQQILTEIQTGLVPPVGGRIIQVPQTGEMAFVGFGSDIVRQSDNPTLRARHRLNAERVAQARASDALVGVIIGDDVSWKQSIDEQTRQIVEEFATLENEGDVTRERFENARTSFINTQQTTSEFQSFRRGVLPPGVMTRGFTSDDQAEAFAVSVYMPSVSRKASAAADAMSRSQIVEPQSQGAQGQSSEPRVLEAGPSGQMTDDSNL